MAQQIIARITIDETGDPPSARLAVELNEVQHADREIDLSDDLPAVLKALSRAAKVDLSTELLSVVDAAIEEIDRKRAGEQARAQKRARAREEWQAARDALEPEQPPA